MARSASSVPASLARRASSPSHHLRASAGEAPAATVSATRSSAPALCQRGHVRLGQVPLGHAAGPGARRASRAARPGSAPPSRRGGDRHQVGLGEVPVVLGLFLGPPGGRGPGVLVEVPGLLDDPAAGVEHGGLPLDLEPDRALHRTQRVDVLGLRARPPAAGPARRQRGVHVAAQRALFHPHVGDAQGPEQIPQLGDVGAGGDGRVRAGSLDRLGHDLHQRDAGPVVVDERVLGAVDPAGGPAHVQRLAGVLLQVHPLDPDPDGPAIASTRRPASRPCTAARRTGRSGSSSACPGRSSSSARTGTRSRSSSSGPGRS